MHNLDVFENLILFIFDCGVCHNSQFSLQVSNYVATLYYGIPIVAGFLLSNVSHVLYDYGVI